MLSGREGGRRREIGIYREIGRERKERGKEGEGERNCWRNREREREGRERRREIGERETKR